MCNLYSVTKGQAAIIAATRAMRATTGNLPSGPRAFFKSRRLAEGDRTEAERWLGDPALWRSALSGCPQKNLTPA
jgi:hypothetical protein